MTRFQAALLDLDGTLLDSVPDLAMAANAMRRELNLPVLREAVIATFVGQGIDKLVTRALAGSLNAPLPDTPPNPALFEHARASFYRHYHLINGDKTTVFDGVIEGLKALQALGLKLAVVTNKPSEFTLPLLQSTGLANFFQVVVCGDSCVNQKPHPQPVLYACTRLGVAPEHTIMLGDSSNDAQAGHAAGACVLLVPYGYNEGRDVRTLHVDAIVSDLVEASQWIALNGDFRI